MHILKNINIQNIAWDQTMVLISYGNIEYVAQAWRKRGIFSENNSNLWLLSIWQNALKRLKTEIESYVRT